MLAHDDLHSALLLALCQGNPTQAAALEAHVQAVADTPASPGEQIVAAAKARALFACAERAGWQTPAGWPAQQEHLTHQPGYAALWDAVRAEQPRVPAPTIRLPGAVNACLDAIRAAGGRPLLFGGAVRDALLGEHDSDLDFKVYGLSTTQLRTVLLSQGQVHETQRTFEVRLSDGSEIDVNTVKGSTPEETAALESDLTINALAYDPATATLLDFYGGVADLWAGVLRHVSAAFADDLIRMLRAMRFAARWNFRLAPETAALGRALAADYLQRPSNEQAALLPRDRQRTEWLKFAATCRQPSAGLRALAESGWLALYPELAALEGCPQDPQFHPEGDVLVHTGHAADIMARLCDDAGIAGVGRQVQILAIVGHDIGKSVVTIGSAAVERQTIAARMRLLGETEAQAFSAVAQIVRGMRVTGRIRSPGHAEIGVQLCATWLERIGCPHMIRQQVLPLVLTHMRPVGVSQPTARMVRRLARDLDPATLEQWTLLVDADSSGRPPLPPRRVAARWLALAEREGVHRQKLPPLLRGADLLATGLAPGPQIGQILRLAEDAQINGAFTDRDGALRWLEQYRSDQRS